MRSISYKHEINFSMADMAAIMRTWENTKQHYGHTDTQTNGQEYTKIFPSSYFHIENA